MHTFLAALPLLLASDPVHLAVCRAKPDGLFPRGAPARVELIAAVHDGTPVEVDVGRVGAQAPVVETLSRARWYALDEAGRLTASGGFPEARVVHLWNETEDGDPEPPAIGEDTGKLVLGACGAPGTVYATASLRSLTGAAAPGRAAMRARGIAEDRGELLEFRASGDGSLVWSVARVKSAAPDEMRAWFPEEMRRAMPEAFDRELRVWTLEHPALEEPMIAGGLQETTWVDVELARVVVLPSGERVALVISRGDGIEKSDWEDADVLVIGEDRVRRTGIPLAGWGC